MYCKHQEMAEKLTDHTVTMVTEDMKETIRKLNIEITQLKSDLNCVCRLHKACVTTMQKSFQDTLNLLTNKTKVIQMNSYQETTCIPKEMGNSYKQSESITEHMEISDQVPSSVPVNIESSNQEPDKVSENVENSNQESDSISEDIKNINQQPITVTENIEDRNHQPENVPKNKDFSTDERFSFNQSGNTDHIYCIDHTYSLKCFKTLSYLEATENKKITGSDTIATQNISMEEELVTDKIPTQNINIKEELVADEEEILLPHYVKDSKDIEELECLNMSPVLEGVQQSRSKEIQHLIDSQAAQLLPILTKESSDHAVLKFSQYGQNILDDQLGVSSSNYFISNSDVQGEHIDHKVHNDVMLILPRTTKNDHHQLNSELINKNFLVRESETIEVKDSLVTISQTQGVQGKRCSLIKNVQKATKQMKSSACSKNKVKINPLTGKPYQTIRPKPGSDVSEDIPMDKDENEKKDLQIQKKEFKQSTLSKICFVCGKYFEKRNSMNAHLKTHETGLHQCDKCDKCFKRRYHLEEHMYSHDRIKRFVCELCGKSMRYNSSFHAHKRRHENDLRAPCDICNKHFLNRGTMLKHRARHETELKFKCALCKAKYKYESQFVKHLKEHEERPFECLDCDEKCTNAESFTKHVLGHYEALPFGCLTCGKAFTKTEYLSKHVKQHMFRKSYKHFCDQCDVLFRSKSTLDDHKQRQHGIMVSCEDCGQTFSNVTERDSHTAIHVSKEPNLVFGCTYCNKGFTKSGHLKFHVGNAHTLIQK